ncbi:hypothetical protein [Paenibacillus sp. YYML68]|uniref:hypothetical protein n=1 Tax=Paenibacillus sp. YYML68 TaxID=2909250 RepID=UPI00249271B2|nr:hypothetical protein [Paenibacillus sp. YYML68]
MNTFQKKMMTGTLAAALLTGSVGLVYGQAFAETADTTSGTAATQEQAKPQDGRFGGKGRDGQGARGAHMNKEGKAGKAGKEGKEGKEGKPVGMGFGKGDLAALLGTDEETLRTELSQGKTLAQVAEEKAGLSEEALLQKLVESETAKLQEAVAAGKLTQEQADERVAKASERLKEMITSTKPLMGGKGQHGKQRDGKHIGMMGNPEVLTTILGVTKEELKAATQEGKSVADIAAEKGISREQLITALKAGMDEKLAEFIDRKRTAPASAPAGQEAPASEATGA